MAGIHNWYKWGHSHLKVRIWPLPQYCWAVVYHALWFRNRFHGASNNFLGWNECFHDMDYIGAPLQFIEVFPWENMIKHTIQGVWHVDGIADKPNLYKQGEGHRFSALWNFNNIQKKTHPFKIALAIFHCIQLFIYIYTYVYIYICVCVCARKMQYVRTICNFVSILI